MQHRRMNIRDVMTVFDGVEAEFASVAPWVMPPLISAAGHEDGEAEGMMVAAVGRLRSRGCGRIR